MHLEVDCTAVRGMEEMGHHSKRYVIFCSEGNYTESSVTPGVYSRR